MGKPAWFVTGILSVGMVVAIAALLPSANPTAGALATFTGH